MRLRRFISQPVRRQYGFIKHFCFSLVVCFSPIFTVFPSPSPHPLTIPQNVFNNPNLLRHTDNFHEREYNITRTNRNKVRG